MDIQELLLFVPTSLISDMMLVVIKFTSQVVDILFGVNNFLSFICFICVVNWSSLWMKLLCLLVIFYVFRCYKKLRNCLHMKYENIYIQFLLVFTWSSLQVFRFLQWCWWGICFSGKWHCIPTQRNRCPMIWLVNKS